MSETLAERIIGFTYMFAWDADVVPQLLPVLAVAVRGQVGDWAAYIAGVPGLGQPGTELQALVCREGFKLTEVQARGLFPHVDGEYRP